MDSHPSFYPLVAGSEARFLAMDDANLLPKIRGEYLAPAIHSLPDPATAETCQRTIEVPGHGLVTITFERYSYKHGRNRFTTWKAIRAVQCEG